MRIIYSVEVNDINQLKEFGYIPGHFVKKKFAIIILPSSSSEFPLLALSFLHYKITIKLKTNRGDEVINFIFFGFVIRLEEF